jgi:hypothetical protein
MIRGEVKGRDSVTEVKSSMKEKSSTLLALETK